MVKYTENVSVVQAVSAKIENGKVEQVMHDFTFKGHRSPERVQLQVDRAVKELNIRATVVSIEQTTRTYQMPREQFLKLAEEIIDTLEPQTSTVESDEDTDSKEPKK